MAIYVHSHLGAWELVGQIDSISLPKALVACVDQCPFLVASGNHISAASEVFSPVSKAWLKKQPLPRISSTGSTTVAEVLLELGGARPYWHPANLKLLLGSGRLAALANLLRSLLDALQKVRNWRLGKLRPKYLHSGINLICAVTCPGNAVQTLNCICNSQKWLIVFVSILL